MKLLGFELKKLFGIKYLWVMLLLTTVLCTGLYYYLYIGDINFSEPYYDRESNAMTEDFFRRCENEPETIAQVRESYEAYVIEADRVSEEIRSTMTKDELVGFRVTDEMLAEHGVIYENKLGYVRKDGTVVPDKNFFEAYSLRGLTAESLIKHVDDIIYLTGGAMERFEAVGAEELPIYEYESHYNEVYSSLRSKLADKMRPAEPRGMENMFWYREFPLFAYAFLLLASGVIFLNERSVGLLPVIRTTRGGRARTAAAKLGALLTVAVLTVLCLTAAQLIVTYIKFGITFGDAPVQYMCRNCPYLLTINGYFICVTLLRILAAAVFSCVVALIASVTVSHIVTYISGALILGVNIVIGYSGNGTGLSALNLIDLGNDALLSKYDESLLFGHFVGTLALGMALLSLSLVLSGALLVAVGGRRSHIYAPSRIRKLIPAIRSKFASAAEKLARRRHSYPSSLFVWEVSRLMTPAAVFAAILLLALSVYSSVSRYTESTPPSLIKYEEYLNENWTGELTDERYAQFLKRYDELALLTKDNAHEELMSRYTRGEITFEEYIELLDSIESASDEIELLESILPQVEHLRALKAETGVTGWIFPDTHIMRLLNRDINFFLLIAVLIIFSRMYSPDYSKKSFEGDFAAILRTAKNGRRKNFVVRFSAAALTSLILAALFEAADLCLGIANTGNLADVLSAPVSSIELYGSLGSMTVGGFLALTAVLRTISYVPLALLCCSASFAVKKVPPTLFIVTMITLLPYVLVYMGFPKMMYVDFTAVLAGSKLLTRSAQFDVLGGSFTFTAALLVGFVLIAAAGTLYTLRKTGKD